MGENFVWPAIIKERVMLWSPVSTRHSRYYHDVVFIFTPTVVCVEVDVLLAEPMYFQEVMDSPLH